MTTEDPANFKAAPSIIIPKQTDASDVTQNCPMPNGWGRDSLTQFLEQAHRNRYATFVNLPVQTKRLIDIDAKFLKIVLPNGDPKSDNNWVNPQSLTTPALFMRAHGAYRAAAEHALAGQIAETYPLVRATLEYAGYALHISKNPSVEEVWLRRTDSPAHTKAVKDEFTIRRVKDTIAQHAAGDSEAFNLLYERSIWLGGHPNEGAVTASLNLVETEGRKVFNNIYLHENGLQMEAALRSVTQTGVCALGILSNVFGPRFMLLGVSAALPELRKGL